ncbi:MAG: dihydropyrimidinase [Gemmatimonadetes bacterium]|nr:dihydropyrimidinase [Gemmatimonadota bacterium]
MNRDSILIRGGTVVVGDDVMKASVLVRGETIAEVGELAGVSADRVVDATGLLVLPGAIDPHVHFNETNKGHKGVHHYFTGGRAAAFGGTTAIVDFADQLHGQPLLSVLDVKKEQARGQAVIDWNVHPIINQVTPEVVEEIPAVVAAGLPTIKCFMTFRSLTGESAVNMYSGKPGRIISDQDYVDLTTPLGEAGGMLMVHAEDSTIIDKIAMDKMARGETRAIDHAQCRPPMAEAHAIQRIAGVAKKTGCPVYIVHLSSIDGLGEVTAAKENGIPIWAETCPHFLIFTEEWLKREDGYKWLGSPPLRDEATQEVLWEALRDGRISVMATDDCAFSLESKLAGAENFEFCPEGMPGIEPRLTIMYSEGVAKGRITLPQLVELTATAPARLFGFAPKKGTLTPGSDADIVLFDPSVRWTMSQETLHMASDYTSYEGVEVTGKVAKVFSRGELIVDGEEFLAEPGRGRFVPCKLG